MTAAYCWLVNNQWVSADALPKPILQLVTEDPENIIMKGAFITLKCITGSEEVNQFYLVNKETNETREESSGKFQYENIQNNKIGDYFCKYSKHNVYSNLSTPLNIFVQDTFPKPFINVSPRRVVQPGAAVTITCSTHYSNVEFSLLKTNVIITRGSGDGHKFSHVISDAKKGNEGFYTCTYKSTTRDLQSLISNTMKISVLALPAPSVTWEEDPSDSRILRINCTAPDNQTYNWFYFMLLEDSKVSEIAAKESTVTFSVTKPKYSTKRYQCMYQIKLDFDYADSLHSIQIEFKGSYIWMFIRHILSALILIFMGIILLLHFKEKKQPDLPPARVRYAKVADDSQVIWTSDDKQKTRAAT
ncbi:alpha-1B-glycoprotein-like [Rhinoderma darwinii]|uniref:alpha-1B-glycoprotein-like n=1 Tax=Rhinoderma darwinii TaxID=43563 RepID=UPI003F68214C